VQEVHDDMRLHYIVVCLADYARGGRIYNLDTFAGSEPPRPSPYELWKSLEVHVLRSEPELWATVGTEERCRLGLHEWRKRWIEGEQYLSCPLRQEGGLQSGRRTHSCGIRISPRHVGNAVVKNDSRGHRIVSVVEVAAIGTRRGVKGWRTDESAGQWTSCLWRAEAAGGEVRRRFPASAP
jgi:hypothetical protein